MPASRTKACVGCRLAKEKCTSSALQTPCSRCTARSLRCSLTNHGPRQPRNDCFRVIRPTLNYVSPDDLQPQKEHEVLTSINQLAAPSAEGIVIDSGYATFDTISPRIIGALGSSNASRGPGGHRAKISKPLMSVQQTSKGPPCEEAIVSIRFLGTGGQSIAYPLASQSFEKEPLTSHDSLEGSPPLATLNPADISSRSVGIGPQLTQRGRSLQQGSLTAKMLLSRLADFTRMIAECVQLPPFIHPPCWSNGGQPCPLSSAHQCLPPILSTCAGLIYAFYTWASKGNLLVWQQIFEHLRLLRAEHELYNEQSTLQAMQAAILYGILCSQCSAEQSSEYYGLVVMCIETLGKRLFSMVRWDLGADHIGSSYERWIMIESIRRLGCTLYLIDLLLHTSAKTPSRGDCETFWDMPLPCYRELWLARSYEAWIEQSQGGNAGTILPEKQQQTLGKLLPFRRAKRLDETLSRAGGSAFAEELAEWCERADDLSMLLWMALTVEGEGQSIRQDDVDLD